MMDTKMKKFVYRLMTSGILHKLRIRLTGQVMAVEWRAQYFGEEKVVYAQNEDFARATVRAKLKERWSGFLLEEAPQADA
ncbi:MAG: hypothetical protein A2Y16_05460 [Tenericutes bacterium GWF2_57_13]|nr:MAG: hypothetical protein A2Y16_05460 [Tenericutes bacterium GWF2_57_13]